MKEKSIQGVFDLAIKLGYYKAEPMSPHSDHYSYMCGSIGELYNRDIITEKELLKVSSSILQFLDMHGGLAYMNCVTSSFLGKGFSVHSQESRDLSFKIYQNWNNRHKLLGEM